MKEVPVACGSRSKRPGLQLTRLQPVEQDPQQWRAEQESCAESSEQETSLAAAAEFANAHFKADPGARGGLVKNERPALAGE